MNSCRTLLLFAVTDYERKFVLAVATLQDLEVRVQPDGFMTHRLGPIANVMYFHSRTLYHGEAFRHMYMPHTSSRLSPFWFSIGSAFTSSCSFCRLTGRSHLASAVR